MTKETEFKINKFGKCLIACLVYSSIIAVVVMAYLVYDDVTIPMKDKYMIYVTSFMTLGILIAYRQIVNNNDFQKRQFSMSETSKLLKNNKFHRDELNKIIDYSNLSQKREPISVEEIHKLICISDEKGNYGNKPYQMSEDGKKIRSHMTGLLNNFEQLGIGILHNTLDEDIMKDGFDAIIDDNYTFYSSYIKHIRSDENKSDFAENFEWLQKRWNDSSSHNKTVRD